MIYVVCYVVPMVLTYLSVGIQVYKLRNSVDNVRAADIMLVLLQSVAAIIPGLNIATTMYFLFTALRIHVIINFVTPSKYKK